MMLNYSLLIVEYNEKYRSGWIRCEAVRMNTGTFCLQINDHELSNQNRTNESNREAIEPLATGVRAGGATVLAVECRRYCTIGAYHNETSLRQQISGN
jgi:hypothetical protein